ncbi:hypothetical protein HFD88_010343 [Aspergillus terreus]|nr:hypothetical protein HFD88_010343 [Aspergillus terreus]
MDRLNSTCLKFRSAIARCYHAAVYIAWWWAWPFSFSVLCFMALVNACMKVVRGLERYWFGPRITLATSFELWLYHVVYVLLAWATGQPASRQ